MTSAQTPSKKSLAAIIGAPAALVALVFVGHNEGVSLKPYKDVLAHDVNTVCYGDTGVPMHTYTLSQCQTLLDTRLADYAEPVRDLTVGFDNLTVGQKVAVIDFAYNVGETNYKNSTLRKMYAANQFPAACDQYLRWTFIDGHDCKLAENGCIGLYTRRQRAQALCKGETPQ